MPARILSAAIVITLAAAALAADPPRPNLKTPVDYIKWANEEFGADVKDNAAEDYAKAAELFKTSHAVPIFIRDFAARWTSEEREAVEKDIRANEPALAAFARAAKREGCFLRFESSSGELLDAVDDQGGVLSPCRGIAQVTIARARLRLADDDASAALDDIAAVLSAALHFEQHPTLSSFLGGLGMRSLAYAALLEFPTRATKIDYDAVLRRVESVDRESRPPLRYLTFELVLAWDVLQRHLRDGDGDGKCDALTDFYGQDFPVDPPRSLDEIAESKAKQSARLRDLFVEDYAQAHERAKAFDAALKGERIIETILVSSASLALVHRRTIAMRHGVHCVLALHAYKEKHGKWPEKLEDAFTDKSATVLVDPFSNRQLVYKLKDGAPLLYSVAYNGVDDGGEIVLIRGKPDCQNTGDYVFWPWPESTRMP